MSIQYATEVPWDSELIDVEFVNSSTAPEAFQGLAKTAVKVTVGAPSNVTTAGKFIPGAVIYGDSIMGGYVWRNTGSTASPLWA